MGDPRVMTEYRLTRQSAGKVDTATFTRFVDGGGYIEVNGEASVCGGTGGPDDWRVGWDWLMRAGFVIVDPKEHA